MSATVVIISIVVLTILGCFCRFTKETLMFWIPSLVFLIWLWLFIYAEPVIDHIEIIKPVTVGNVKVICYKKDDVVVLENLNSIFSQQISDDTMVKVIFYKTGPYYWLYSPITPTKLELVPAGPKEEEKDAEL